MPHEYLEKKLFEAYKETESRVYNESFYHALCHDNLHLVEILIDKGFDYTQVLQGSRSAIVICADKETFKVLEYLLVLSVRENNLYAPEDLKYVLNYALNSRHYELIDLLLFALKQNIKDQKELVNFISIKELLFSLSEIAKQSQKIPINQMLSLKNLINSRLLTKRQMNYLYYLWGDLFSSDNQQGLEIYYWLADAYCAVDKESRQKKISREMLTLCILSPVLILSAFIIMLVCFDVYTGFDYLLEVESKLASSAFHSSYVLYSFFFITLPLGIIFLLYHGIRLFYMSYKNIIQLRSEQFDRDLLLHARQGNVGLVKHLILKKRAHINVIAGIAETTPLYEAHRSQHHKVENFLIENGGYSMQGNQVF